MSRFYTVVVTNVASPANTFDFLEINPASNKPVRLRRILIAQTSEPTTEEEQLSVTVGRGHTTTGSGGSTPTPAPRDVGGGAAGMTTKTMNTTIASAGTNVALVEMAWNTRAGLDLAFAPEESPSTINGTLMVVRSGAPADSVTIRATFWLEELG